MTPYYNADGITILHGDCRELLPRLPTPRATITDCPYGETSLEWDRWVQDWPSHVTGQTLWNFGSFRMYFDHAHEFKEAGWKFAQDVVWEKHNGSGPKSDRFLRVHELCAHFYRGSWSDQLQQTPTTPDATRRAIRRKKRPPHFGNIDACAYESQDGGPRLARSVQYFPSEHGRAEHPTPKSPGFCRLLIEYSTKPGDLVIDMFCGGGAVLLAAKQLGRRAIGIDINERWCEASARRLGQELALRELPPIEAHGGQR